MTKPKSDPFGKRPQVFSMKRDSFGQNDPYMQTARRLRNAPRPEMRPEAVHQLQRRVLASHHQQYTRPNHAPSSWPIAQFAVAAAITALMTFGVLPTILQNAAGRDRHATIETLPTLVPFSTELSGTPVLVPTSPGMIVPANPEPLPVVVTPTPDVLLLTFEGPVEVLTENSVTVWGMEIEIDSAEPLFDLIEVGDIVRVEANPQPADGGMVILADSIRLVEVEAFTNETTGEAWRDNGRCDNPPPAWAPAYGWHRRCEGTNGNGRNPSGQGNNGSNGNPQGQGNNGSNGNPQGQGNNGSNGNPQNPSSGGNNGNPPGQGNNNNSGSPPGQSSSDNNGNSQNQGQGGRGNSR